MTVLTQEEKRSLVRNIMIAAQKTYSNALEVERKQVVDLLMGEGAPFGGNPRIVHVCELLLEKEEISGLDFYNLLILVDRNIQVKFYLAINEIQVPEPDMKMIIEA